MAPYSIRICLGALLLALMCLGTTAPDAVAKGGKRAEKVERYPASFRLAVKEAITAGVRRIKNLQAVQGHWGNAAHDQTMGHTALPLLALLKAGVDPEDPSVKRAFKALAGMKMQRVYSVALYLMAIQARYQPTLDGLDTEIGTARRARVKPKDVRAKLSKEHAGAIRQGLDYLLRAQNTSDLWGYDVLTTAISIDHDLSNTQYGLLGLRAAVDCGFKVKAPVWQAALRALLKHQDAKGAAIELQKKVVRDGYAYASKEAAELRPFHYTIRRMNGPLGERTLWANPPTGSMTTAGIACMVICQEGLWRTRKFKGADRKKSRGAIRDGLAWMQKNFSVTTNPGHPNKRHHMYYLYGLERMGMLAGVRWLGTHDWYKEGADLLLQRQDVVRGGWGRNVATAFGILFLKRATRGTDIVVLTD
jgi:hypothetical protein